MNLDRGRLFEALGERLVFREETGSTNDDALSLARKGADHGLVVLAERQTSGRGRRGAAWFAGEGSGLAFSILLRPTFSRALWPRLALVAGLAVARSLERAGALAEIKWPNDVLIGGKKVCGILVEAEGDAVVIGIGVNVLAAVLPGDLADKATCLAAETGREVIREDVFLGIIAELDQLVPRVGHDFPALLRMMRERCALDGKRISLISGGRRREGICRGIGEGGELLLEEESEIAKVIQADEIRPL